MQYFDTLIKEIQLIKDKEQQDESQEFKKNNVSTRL